MKKSNSLKKILIDDQKLQDLKSEYSNTDVLVNKRQEINSQLISNFIKKDITIINSQEIEQTFNKSINKQNTFNLNVKSQKEVQLHETQINQDLKSVSFDVKSTFLDSNNTIWINIDDEISILKMNTRVCNRGGILLNLCSKSEELLLMLGFIQNNQYKCLDEYKPHVIILSDHMLEREFGYEVITASIELNTMLSLDMRITQILLSSSEEKDVINKYEELGVEFKVKKPLNKKSLDDIKEYLKKIEKNNSIHE